MPEIPDELLKSVVILLEGYKKPVGTGFVVMHRIVDLDIFDAFYLVTCEHCVEKPVKARFSNGSSMSIAPDKWRRPKNGADVVAFEITDQVASLGAVIGNINTGSIVKPGEPFFGIGTDLYMLGLLVDEQDTGQNLPRARFGNLSAFADDRAPMRQGNGAILPCHLGDMRSRTGFSGSPVIGYVEISGLDGYTKYKNRLFGVHSAQHSERIRVATPSSYTALDIPSSMTRIVPAWEMLNLIENDEVFVENQRIRKRDGKGTLRNTGNV